MKRYFGSITFVLDAPNDHAADALAQELAADVNKHIMVVEAWSEELEEDVHGHAGEPEGDDA